MAGCPFHGVPNDLLCEIFLLCLPSNRWETTPSPSEVPTVLTLVCKRWRVAALDFPLLWCWMQLPIFKGIWKDKEAVVQTMEHFGNILKRSQSAPLSLMVTSKHPHLRAVANPSSLSNLLRSTTSSLTRLILHKIPLSLVASLPPGQFHALQSLVYCKARMKGGDPAATERVVAFRAAPSLRRVALDTTFPFYGRGAPICALPWNQLTHFLDCDGLSKSAPLFTRHLVTQSTNLQWLSLRLTEEETDQVEANEVWERAETGPDFTVMRGVTTLALSFRFLMAYPTLLDIVDFPNVRTLRLEARGAWDLGEDQIRFLTRLRTFKKVEFLSLSFELIGNGELESLFESTPTVHTLQLFVRGSYSSIFGLLGDKGDLLPRLHTLVLKSTVYGFGGAAQSTISGYPLQRLLEARTPGTHPTSHIRRIVVWGGEPVDVGDGKEFVKVIKKFVENADMVFERHVGGRVEDMEGPTWMKMDPASHGWEEAGVAQNLLRL